MDAHFWDRKEWFKHEGKDRANAPGDKPPRPELSSLVQVVLLDEAVTLGRMVNNTSPANGKRKKGSNRFACKT